MKKKKNNNSKESWIKKYNDSAFRDYSFDSVSGAEVRPLYDTDNSKINLDTIWTQYLGNFQILSG